MVRQLLGAFVDDRGASTRLAGPFACFAVDVGAPVGSGLYRKCAWFVMLLATLIFLPVLIYTSIVFRALRGVVTASHVEKNSSNLY
jgi:hypothetical protein